MKPATHQVRAQDPVVGASEPLWGFQEVAAYLNVPEATLRRWRFYGNGPTGVRIGRHVRYDPDDVRAWWTAQKRLAARSNGRGPDGW